MNYEEIIKNILDGIIKIELISDTNNKVFKVKLNNNKNLYAKFYENNSSHTDNELKVYDLIDNKYLKELYYKSLNSKLAVFKELKGKTIDELNNEELEKYSDKIIESVCNYFDSISKFKTTGYGILDDNLHGKYDSFFTFLNIRQQETSSILSEYNEWNSLYDSIISKYKKIIIPDNSLVPIDTNLKNIMLLNDGNVKFIDPGEMISGPILMGYGDFVAHTYKTILYDKLIKKLNLDSEQEKLLRIYAIFSSLNVLAFLRKNGVKDLKRVVPYGNKYTFYALINDHLKYLEL